MVCAPTSARSMNEFPPKLTVFVWRDEARLIRRAARSLNVFNLPEEAALLWKMAKRLDGKARRLERKNP